MKTACINMIKQQLRTNQIFDERILQLFQEIPRDEFVPAEHKALAYADAQIELAHGQRMFTPLEEALIVQALNLSGTENLLEVGTGSGFLTALLSRLSRSVTSVDYFADFTEKAQENLRKNQCNNVALVTADAATGFKDKGLFDCIILTAASDALTESQRLQLFPGGKIFAFIGKSPVVRAHLYQLDHENHWSNKELFTTDIPSFVTAQPKNTFLF
jgi:protein-L-isoaspartate(D-aspartate) O-methyltransferase